MGHGGRDDGVAVVPGGVRGMELKARFSRESARLTGLKPSSEVQGVSQSGGTDAMREFIRPYISKVFLRMIRFQN